MKETRFTPIGYHVFRNLTIGALFAFQLIVGPQSINGQTLERIPYGSVDINDKATEMPQSVRPLFDTFLRDTQICKGPDGIYYMTGTCQKEGVNAVTWNEGINLWSSIDLKHWKDLGLVVRLDDMDSWISKYYVWPAKYTEPGKIYSREELPFDPDKVPPEEVRAGLTRFTMYPISIPSS